MKRGIRRLLLLLLVCGLLFAATDRWLGQSYYQPSLDLQAEVEPPPVVEAAAAVVVDATTGKTICSKQESAPMYPASLTKLLTALLVAEKADWSTEVVVGKEVACLGPNSSIAGLRTGDRLTVEDLVWATLLPSGNDAAHVLAVHVGRLVGGQQLTPAEAVALFVRLMNVRARELGARNTHFVNPDGYHHDQQVSTAWDLTLIAQAAYAHPQLAPILGAEQHTIQIQRAGRVIGQVLWNTNQLLVNTSVHYYKWATGLKTGTTPEAGCCLAATASKGRDDVLLVILQSTEDGRYTDATALFEYAFSSRR